MANEEDVMKEIEKVDERLARLELTVAKEFLEIKDGFQKVHRRFDAVDGRFDRLEAAFKLQDNRIAEGFRKIGQLIERLSARRPRRGKRQ